MDDLELRSWRLAPRSVGHILGLTQGMLGDESRRDAIEGFTAFAQGSKAPFARSFD